MIQGRQKLHPLVEGIRAGNLRALARAISCVEDGLPDGRQILSEIHPFTGKSHVIGVTGSPGTGKSTLVNALARAYRRTDVRVGVIAVDPSSPFSGGALLGDRVRMTDLAGDSGIFIRSMASRGSLGGLARATSDVVQLIDAAGFDRIIVETVGAGQSEVEIADAAHTTIVVEAPGMGDEVQAFKAGLLEIADILVVNKADRDDADRTVLALQAMQQSFSPSAMMDHHLGEGVQVTGSSGAAQSSAGPRPEGWLPPILKTVAVSGVGIDAVYEWVETHARYLRDTNGYTLHEVRRALTSVRDILHERLSSMLMSRLPEGYWDRLIDEIANRKIDPHAAVDEMIGRGSGLA
jgi:LAO/AO transport system kinase